MRGAGAPAAMQTSSVKPRYSIIFVAAATMVMAALGVTACGTDSGPTTGKGAGGGGGGGSGQGGQGGQGGASMKECPATPPSNMDSCDGFALGDQCNYSSSSTGMVSSTACQCMVGGSGQAWSCGTEASGVGAGGGAASSSSGG